MKGSRVSGLSPWVGEEGSEGEGDQGQGGAGSVRDLLSLRCLC